MPKTTVVILSWNALRYTKITLEYLLRSSENFNLLIWDNGSDNEVINYLKSLPVEIDGRNIRIVYSNDNLGVWRGRFQATRQVDTEYICFMDNDVVVPNKWLSNMENEMNLDNKLGLVGPLKISKHLVHPYIDKDIKSYWHYCEDIDSDPKIQFNHFLHYHNLDSFTNDLLKKNKDTKAEIDIPTRSISGCLMLTRKILYENSDLNDSNYSKFKYGMEDIDYSWSLNKHGYRVKKCITTYVHHFEHSSVDENQLKIGSSGDNANLIYFTRKWADLLEEWLIKKIRFENIPKSEILHDEFIHLISQNIPTQMPANIKKIIFSNT